MAFSTRQDEILAVGGGVIVTPFKVDSYVTFEEGLAVGKFAKLDTGSLDNMDGSATPTIAGVVHKSIVNGLEAGDTYTKLGDGAVHQVDAVSFGVVTVQVVDADEPTKFGTVYAVNASGSGDDFGKATVTATDNVEVNGYFNREVKAGVWEIFIQL